MYSTAPSVANGVASSMVGIKKIEYGDGKMIRFRKIQPKVVSIGNGAVRVYDTLGNVVEVE